MKTSRMLILLVLLALLTTLGLTGCGGGGSVGDTATGQMSFSVTFPPRTQKAGTKNLTGSLVSVVIDILDATQTGNPPKVSQIIVNSPSPSGGKVTINVPDVPVGLTLLKVRGYDSLDGGGQLVCIASTECTVTLNETVQVSMTMDSTSTLVVVTGPTSVVAGQNIRISASASDVDGAGITNPSFEWTSSDDTIATVTPDTTPAGAKTGTLSWARVDGLKRGTVTITVEDTVSAVSATLDIEVYPAIDEVVVTPATKTINQDLTFDVTAQAKVGGVVENNVDFTFTSLDETILSVVKSSTLKDKATVTALKAGTAKIEVTQPYTNAKGYCDVTVTANGSIDIILD